MNFYVAVFRGTPLVVQLFVWYYGLPHLGIFFSPVGASIFGFAMCSGAYHSEYIRGGLLSIRQGQLKAAQALGFTPWQAVTNIILPQAFKAGPSRLRQRVRLPHQVFVFGLHCDLHRTDGHGPQHRVQDFPVHPCLHGGGCLLSFPGDHCFLAAVAGGMLAEHPRLRVQERRLRKPGGDGTALSRTSSGKERRWMPVRGMRCNEGMKAGQEGRIDLP